MTEVMARPAVEALPPERRFPSRLRRTEPDARSVPAVVASWSLTALCLLALWVAFYALELSGFQEAHAQHNAYAAFREQLSRQTAPLGGVVNPGSPVALLDSSALGIRNLVVTEGTSSGDLERGPGHRRDTLLPGQVGVSVVYGRSRLFGGPFGHMARARVGDVITATTGQGRFTFRVEGVRHVGHRFPAALPNDGSRLTLVTSEGASARNLWQPDQPLYVDAALVGKALPSPGGSASSVPKAEQSMQSDPGSLLQLVLWLPLLALVASAATWAATRWGAWQAWVTGFPLVLGVLWGASETAVQLLPNLL